MDLVLRFYFVHDMSLDEVCRSADLDERTELVPSRGGSDTAGPKFKDKHLQFRQRQWLARGKKDHSKATWKPTRNAQSGNKTLASEFGQSVQADDQEATGAKILSEASGDQGR